MKILNNTDKVIKDTIAELPELYETRFRAEGDGAGWWDYLEGSIEARITMLVRLGVPLSEIPEDKYTAGDC